MVTGENARPLRLMCVRRPPDLNESKMRAFAVIGARMRLLELQAEIDSIKKQFGVRVLGISTRPGSDQAAGETKQTQGRRRRRRMSAEARRRISEAQKARWRKQKAGK